jgi:hypothetical protein
LFSPALRDWEKKRCVLVISTLYDRGRTLRSVNVTAYLEFPKRKCNFRVKCCENYIPFLLARTRASSAKRNEKESIAEKEVATNGDKGYHSWAFRTPYIRSRSLSTPAVGRSVDARSG